MNSDGQLGVTESATTRAGRLTVYFGAAPGVGKTYAMLDEAHRRQDRGTDVVVGLVETHGRAGTAAQLEGLEEVPRRVLTYQGRDFTELDVDAVLRRAPRVAMIDELAHTNVPGSRHEKRWQDVEELLDAGIDVVTTVNVQHLESLNDDVHAITGVRQRETVPDRVVRDGHVLADRARTMTLAQWEHLGLRRAGNRPFPHSAERAYLLAPAGAEGPGFLMLQNFRVIMKYNPAEAYALAIGHFADRLRGGAPFVQPWPRQERELSRAERLELQQLLAQRGFYRGVPDGQLGGQTRDALRSFQASIGAAADGFASSDVLERLRGH